MPMNTASFRYEVDKTIDKMFFAELMRREKYYTKLFASKPAPKGEDYTEATLSEYGIARAVTQGGRPDLDIPVEGNKVTRTYSKVGLSTMMTRELLDDDITGKWKQLPARMVDSVVERVEFDTIGVLENGFTTASAGEDAKALFANNHATLKGATTINNLSTADLSTTALEAAFNYGMLHKGENGFIRPIKPKYVVVAPANMWVVNDLLKATGRVWNYYGASVGAGLPMDINSGLVAGPLTAPGTIAQNQLNPSFGIVDDWKIIVNPYITDADSWYVLFDGFDLRLLWKYEPSLEKDYDVGTESTIWHARARYTCFSNKYSRMYGSAGA